jgi:hypothetical protein
MPIFDWMKGLKDDRKLVELCLPGSHDAGIYQDLTAGVDPGVKARTQNSNIWEQAMCGSRVFDIRCFLRKVKTNGGKTEVPTMGHFFKENKKGSLGEYGGTLMSALKDAGTFLTTYPSEFIIFRIGHTKCTGEVAEALKQFRQTTHPHTSKMIYDKVIFRRARGNLVDQEMRHLRGQLLLVFDNKFNSPNFSVDEGYYPYSKYPEVPNIGLSFCGKYSGGLVTAAAPKSKDKGSWSPEGAVELANAACREHQNHSANSHLLWIYWQETGGDIKENTTDVRGMYNRLDKFLFDVTNSKLPKPNVIGHDFVDKITCTKIVKMNRDVDTNF